MPRFATNLTKLFTEITHLERLILAMMADLEAGQRI